jgi:RND family efflux transporter MFP subunit
MDTDPNNPTVPPGDAPPPEAPGTPDPAPDAPRSGGSTILQVAIVLAILAAGTGITWYLIETGQRAKRKPPASQARLVDVTTVRLARERVVVPAMGTVVAARTVDLQPRVTGEVVALSPDCLPGGRFRAGEEIARIDPKDYALAVEDREAECARLKAVLAQRRSEILERQAALAQREADARKAENQIVEAEASLRLEEGLQAVAKREFELLGESVKPEDRELVLRQPQLRAAKAALETTRAAKASANAARRAAEAMVKSAEAAAAAAESAAGAADVALRKARLDHERTALRAPFNALIETKLVDPGSQVSPASRVARLIGTDTYWVEISVPVDRLKWIRFPAGNGKTGSPVRVFDAAAWGDGVHRTGHVLRLAGALESEGRMARVLVTVPDPLALASGNDGRPALLLGSYVRVEIDGGELPDVIALDRDQLREGDRVWVMDAEDRLAIRPVTVAVRNRDRVLVTEGLKDGDRVVVTDLAAPVAGMPLRTKGTAAAPGPPPGLPAGGKER